MRWLKETRNPLVRIPRALWEEMAFFAGSFRLLKSYELMIVSGGGQLTERGGPWSFPYGLYIWTRMARWAGVRCVFLNVGAGPLNHPLSKFFIARALRKADYVSFRDEQSQSLVVNLGFTRPSHVCPDNVYGFEIAPANMQVKALTPPVVGINPMPYPFCDLPRFPSDAQAIQDELIDKFAAFASSLARSSFALQFFASDIQSDPPEIERMRQILLKRDGMDLPQYVPLHSTEELLAQMSNMDYIVTCRFHGVAFAHLLNKPVLAIAHHRKVTDLMNALGLSEYCVDMLTFEPNRLLETFRSMVADTKAIKDKMAVSLAEYRAKSAAQFDEVFSDLTLGLGHVASKEPALQVNRAVR